MPDEPAVVVKHWFCVPGATEMPERAFDATVYRNRTCLWEERPQPGCEWDGNILVGKDESGFVDVIFADEPPTYLSTLSDKAYWTVLELDAVSLHQKSDETDMWQRIDEILAPYFWRDVNPHLKNGFKRRAAKDA